MFDDNNQGFFTIAAAFGNVHGVYQPGNVKLEPNILDKASSFVLEPIVDVVQRKILGSEQKTTGEVCVWFLFLHKGGFPDGSRLNRFIKQDY